MFRQYDYTNQHWGHSCQLKRTGDVAEDGAPIFSGHVFSCIPLGCGDEIHLDSRHGGVIAYELTTVTWPGDPRDLYMVEAIPVRYVKEPPE